MGVTPSFRRKNVTPYSDTGPESTEPSPWIPDQARKDGLRNYLKSPFPLDGEGQDGGDETCPYRLSGERRNPPPPPPGFRIRSGKTLAGRDGATRRSRAGGNPDGLRSGQTPRSAPATRLRPPARRPDGGPGRSRQGHPRRWQCTWSRCGPPPAPGGRYCPGGSPGCSPAAGPAGRAA